MALRLKARILVLVADEDEDDCLLARKTGFDTEGASMRDQAGGLAIVRKPRQAKLYAKLI